MRGRFKNGRYQQGISTPETLGVQPTTWKEPESAPLYQTKFDAPNVGFTRNYGSTPDYVDTWNSRWTVPKPGQASEAVESASKKFEQKKFDTQSASELGISTKELRSRRVTDSYNRQLAKDRSIFKRTSEPPKPLTRPGESSTVTDRRSLWE